MTAKLALIAFAGIALLVFSACGDSNDSSGGSSDSADASGEQGCKTAQKPAAKTVDVSKPKKELDAKKTYIVDFKTNCGNFSVKLDVKNNPVTASSFANLVEQKVYDGTWFHRIIADFVIQGGDPLGDGTGDAGYNVTEKPTGDYEIGTVAMAKTGTEPAGTSSAQFYIVIGEQGTALPPDYAIAGQVDSGQETVDLIAGFAAPPTDQAGTPTDVALIETATLKTEN